MGIIYQNIDNSSHDELQDHVNAEPDNTSPPPKRTRTLTEFTPDINAYSKQLKMIGRLMTVENDRPNFPENFPMIQTIDLLHLVSHVFHVPNTPMWTGFNCRTIEDNSPRQKVPYLTPINLSPTNTSVVAYTMEQAQAVGKECGQTYVQVTYDLAIAKIAYKIHFIHLGSFHLMQLELLSMNVDYLI